MRVSFPLSQRMDLPSPNQSCPEPPLKNYIEAAADFLCGKNIGANQANFRKLGASILVDYLEHDMHFSIRNAFAVSERTPMNPSNKVPLASEFMQVNVHTVTPEMSLAEVTSFLVKHQISNAPVAETVEGTKRLVGFISERDCLEGLTNESFFGSPAPKQTAATLMRRHPICITPETDLFTLASIFITHGYRHLPVTNGDQLLGIVSRRDILTAVDKYARKLANETAQERFPPDVHQIMNLRFLASR